MRRPTKDPYACPAIQTLERLHAELGGKILENKQEHENLAGQMRHVEAVIKMLDPTQLAGDLREAPPAQPMVQARHRLPPCGGRAQDGRATPYGARGRGAA
jgi:hypothetical protein